MQPDTSDYAQLYLLVQRIVDRDLLDVEEAAELLAEADGARRMQRRGELPLAREHALHVALFVEALVDARALAPWDGRAVIEMARSILKNETEAEGDHHSI